MRTTFRSFVQHFSMLCIIVLVYYVFGHRGVLDFAPFLSAPSPARYIQLPDHVILQILHAHVRVQFILNFNLPLWFGCFQELNWYLNMYVEFHYGGHATGQVTTIHCSADYRYSRSMVVRPVYSQLASGIRVLCGNSWCASLLLTCQNPMYWSPLQWSTFDMDEPYVYEEIDAGWMAEMEEMGRQSAADSDEGDELP